MKKGGPAPAAAKSQKHENVGASTSTHPKSSEPSLTKAEVAAIVEKTVSEALARQKSELQAEITKSTKQQVQDVSDRLLELGNKSLDADAKNVQRVKEVEDTLRDLNQRCGLLDKWVKEELDGFVEAKVRLILRKNQPDSEVEEKKWTEQLARSESVHQEEIQKLHQQHHQDMLSVINDCCRKLKTSFTRQNKPYDVSEVHTIIDDIEQKMIREILSEIEKTDTREDLSSFEEALATSKQSQEVGEAREFNRLSSDDMAASLNAFDNIDNLGSFSQDLETLADAVAQADYEREPVVEENISASRSMITGDRGNVYYTEELKRTVDDMIALAGGTGVNPSEKEPEPDLPAVTRSQSEVEKSLEGLIISGEAASRYEADSLRSKDQEEKDKAGSVADPKLGVQSKAGEILPETSMDLDQLKALEAMVEGDFSWTDIQPSSQIEPEVPKSCEPVKQPVTTTSAKSPQDKDQLKSLETKAEGDFSWAGIPPSSKIEPEVPKSREPLKQPVTTTSAKSPHSQDQLKSLETKAEEDISWAGIQPSSKVEPAVSKPHEPVKKPVTTSAKSPEDQARVKPVEGKTEHHQSAESAHDRDQMKALEEMLEAQMTDSSLDKEGKNVSHVEPTKSAKQHAKANVSEKVTSSALQTTETIKVTPRTGYEENPHYVEEVLGAAASKPKDKP